VVVPTISKIPAMNVKTDVKKKAARVTNISVVEKIKAVLNIS
jgi:hypothetical protein